MKISRTLSSLFKFSQDHLNLYAFKLFKDWGKYYFYLQSHSIEAEKSLKIIIKISFLPVHTMLTCCFLFFPMLAHPDSTWRAFCEIWASLHGSSTQGTCSLLSDQLQTPWHPQSPTWCPHLILTHYLHSHSSLYFFTFCSWQIICAQSLWEMVETCQALHELTVSFLRPASAP